MRMAITSLFVFDVQVNDHESVIKSSRATSKGQTDREKAEPSEKSEARATWPPSMHIQNHHSFQVHLPARDIHFCVPLRQAMPRQYFGLVAVGPVGGPRSFHGIMYFLASSASHSSVSGSHQFSIPVYSSGSSDRLLNCQHPSALFQGMPFHMRGQFGALGFGPRSEFFIQCHSAMRRS